MDLTHLSALISLILALSVASERLVEIIKGLVPFLDKKDSRPAAERRRHSYVQFLAVLSGIFTAWLARDYIPEEIAEPTREWSIIGLGLLASGGSGFWNSILTFVYKVSKAKG